MLHSPALSAIALSLLCVAAPAQSVLTPTKITSQVKNRGRYSLATGTWSRASASDSFGSDVLFNNTAPSGYFFNTAAVFNTIDHGRIPSTSSPSGPTSVAGSGNLYAIGGFQIAYCSNIPIGGPQGGVSATTTFFDDYRPCTDIDVPSAGPYGDHHHHGNAWRYAGQRAGLLGRRLRPGEHQSGLPAPW